MVQYSEAIYNIIRKKIKDIEDVNNYKTISETLLSTNTNFDEKVNQLYTYLKNEGTNISKIVKSDTLEIAKRLDNIAVMLKEYYNELFYYVMDINKRFKKYTDVRGCHK